MLTASDLKIVRFAPVDPDTVNIEIWTPDQRMVAELVWSFDGSKSVALGPERVEIEAPGFVDLMSELSAELDRWVEGLRQPKGAWDPSSSYYTGIEK